MFPQLLNGIRRHPWRFTISIPVGFAALWGTVEAFASAYPHLNSPVLLVILSVGALIFGFAQAWSPKQVSVHWKDLHLTAKIKTGDLFAQDGHIAITADDFFLTQEPKLVNQNSLIGQLVNREYSGQADLLDRELDQFTSSQIHPRIERGGIQGKDKRYPIGTTVVIRGPKKNFFVTALCKVDLSNKCGSATATDVWNALQGLWNAASANPTGRPISVPLFGAGQTGAGLSYSASLNLMLASLLTASRQRPISDEIHIIIPIQALAKIDLRLVQETWMKGI